MNLNRVTIIGRLAQEPTFGETKNGKEKAQFTVTTQKVYTKDGQRREKSEYHSCTAFGRLADVIKMLRVGQQVMVEGELQNHGELTIIVASNVQSYREKVDGIH